MNWQTPITALAGIVGVALIITCYFIVLRSPSDQHIQISSPVLIATPLPNDFRAENNSVAEPRLSSTFDKASESAESLAGGLEGAVPSYNGSAVSVTHASTAVVKTVHLVDHRYDDVVTNNELLQIESSLHLSIEQELKWKALAMALRKGLQPAHINAGNRLPYGLVEGVSADLWPSALILLRSLREEQIGRANKLSLILGFKNLSAMIDAMKASTINIKTHKQTESRVEVTPVLPPIAKIPALADHRYDGLLTKAEIGRIEISLKLTPDQITFWPPIAAILREMGQQQIVQIDTGQKIDYAMNGGMAQRFYYAALPLLQTLSDDQKSEVRRRARTMGLEAYASYF